MFTAWTLNALWQFVASSASVASLIGASAVAVAVLEPPLVSRFVPHLRIFAVYTAIAAFSYSSIAGKFYHDGLTVKQAEWDAAVRAQGKKVDGAVRDSQHDVSTGVRDPYDRDDN